MAGRGRQSASGPAWMVAVAGLAVTLVLASAARAAYDDNEERLLEQRTQEAAAVLDAALPTVETPLAELARLIGAVGDEGGGAIREAMQSLVRERPFVTLSAGRAGSELVTAGDAPKAPALDELIENTVATVGGDPSVALHIVDLLEGEEPRLGFLYVGPSPDRVVAYAEQPTPPDRVSQVEPDDAFRDLHHAVYLGTQEELSDLIFADTTELPLEGRKSTAQVPFGNSHLLLAMSPEGTLGGRLLAMLPWLVLVGGAASTLTVSLLVLGLHRRQRRAEALSDRVEELYSREHVIAHTLQQSLLPSALPVVPEVEITARYVAGALGTEVGGDWYDVIDTGDGRLVVIVGDAAGRGVNAAAVMAAVRYSAHAIAAQGDPPMDVLNQVNRLDGVRGQFVTMLCAVIDAGDRSIIISRAGHPPPLVTGVGGAFYLTGPVGPPVGFLESTEYHADTATVPAGATLLLFTDGLYERRGEDVDTGLERLRRTAGSFEGPLESLLDHLYDQLVGAESRDDVAMLAIRFRS